MCVSKKLEKVMSLQHPPHLISCLEGLSGSIPDSGSLPLSHTHTCTALHFGQAVNHHLGDSSSLDQPMEVASTHLCVCVYVDDILFAGSLHLSFTYELQLVPVPCYPINNVNKHRWAAVNNL